jgi:L-ribulose-5-phosphate 3-epimerase
MKKTSIFSWFGYTIPMEERFKLIKSSGFDGVFLGWSDEYIDIDGDKTRHPDLARREGLFIENIHTPFSQVNQLWCDNLEGENYIKQLYNSVNDCAIFEIPTAVVHLTSGNIPPSFNQIGLDRIKRLVELAERKNINIALENLRKTEYLDFVFPNIQSNKLGFCFDSGHENCYSKCTNLLEKYGSKLMAMHLHDNDGIEDLHQLPFEGNINWNRVIKQINKTKYSGAIALEVTNEFSSKYKNISPEEYLKLAYAAADKLINQ